MPLPRRFPSPEARRQSDLNAWIAWIHEETDAIMVQLDEERSKENDPDDPFNGMASGIFELLNEQGNLLTLPPPKQTPRKQPENTGKVEEHLTHS